MLTSILVLLFHISISPYNICLVEASEWPGQALANLFCSVIPLHEEMGTRLTCDLCVFRTILQIYTSQYNVHNLT